MFEGLTVENGTIKIDTIGRFHGDDTELFAYLHEAVTRHNTVIFENEGIVIDGKADFKQNMELILHNHLWRNPEIVRKYYEGVKILEAE